MKQLYHSLDYICGLIGGFAFIDVLKMEMPLFDNIDNSIKLASALIAFVYLILRTFFYYHKGQSERILLKEQIRTLEIENNKKDLENYLFGKELKELKELKDKNNT
jgi:hypothetical protein